MIFIDIARLLIETVAALLGVTLLLRAFMNFIGMPGRNPFAQFVLALTDWLVRPLRRVVPSAGRVDTASLLAAYIIALLMLILTLLVIGAASTGWSWTQLLLAAAVQVLRWSLYMVFFLVLLHVILSWVNPYAPVAPGIALMVRPFLAPFQKIIPLVGGVDLSPIALIVIVQILLLVVNSSGF
ncbi:MAG: YggT family protein [Burkholderiales bacterium]|nr:YggT family protein [Burkholderiales bacterium]